MDWISHLESAAVEKAGEVLRSPPHLRNEVLGAAWAYCRGLARGFVLTGVMSELDAQRVLDQMMAPFVDEGLVERVSEVMGTHMSATFNVEDDS